MSTALQAVVKFFKLLLLVLTLLNEYRLRREGERRAQQRALESAYEIQGEAHEIDLQIARDGFTPEQLERMRKYQRPHE